MIMRMLLILILFPLNSGIVPAAGDNGDFIIGAGNGMQGKPVLAYDSRRDRFLSVWADLRDIRTHRVDVYGRIVDARGRAVTDDFPVAAVPYSQSNPVAAYDSVNDRFLVVWADWRNTETIYSDIYGRWLRPDGSPDGEAFPVETRRDSSQANPNIAYDPSRQRFLVVWGDSREGEGRIFKLYGRFLDASGEFHGESFRLSRGGEGAEDGYSLAYDSQRKRFFVIWRDIADVTNEYAQRGKTIYGAFVDPGEGVVGEQIWIAFEDDACLPPSLRAADFAPEQDIYLVTWTSARHYHDPMNGKRLKGLDVYGVLIDAGDGSRHGEDFAIASEVDYQEFSAAAFDPIKKRFLVVWYDLRRPPSGKFMDIYGKYIALDGSMSHEFLISDPHLPGIRRFPSLAFSPVQQRFFIVWEDARGEGAKSRRIYGHIE